jgi:pimeloyl-ACP methyl ester carboxylesterase
LHADLTGVANRDAWAEAIASAVGRFRDRHPDRPIFLVAKSGGSGVVIKALERLPPGCVDRVVLIAPALSPSYDLTAALRGVRRDMFVFWSPLDFVILGAGTRIFGTIDRIRSISAGMVGFRPPRSQPFVPVVVASGPSVAMVEGLPRQGYAKLRQVRWRPAMMRTGYFGGHLGSDSPAFLRIYIAPLLRPEAAAGS